jgi:hypothetical protein
MRQLMMNTVGLPGQNVANIKLILILSKGGKQLGLLLIIDGTRTCYFAACYRLRLLTVSFSLLALGALLHPRAFALLFGVPFGLHPEHADWHTVSSFWEH